MLASTAAVAASADTVAAESSGYTLTAEAASATSSDFTEYLNNELAPRYGWADPNDVTGTLETSRDKATDADKNWPQRTGIIGADTFDNSGDGSVDAMLVYRFEGDELNSIVMDYFKKDSDGNIVPAGSETICKDDEDFKTSYPTELVYCGLSFVSIGSQFYVVAESFFHAYYVGDGTDLSDFRIYGRDENDNLSCLYHIHDDSLTIHLLASDETGNLTETKKWNKWETSSWDAGFYEAFDEIGLPRPNAKMTSAFNEMGFDLTLDSIPSFFGDTANSKVMGSLNVMNDTRTHSSEDSKRDFVSRVKTYPGIPPVADDTDTGTDTSTDTNTNTDTDTDSGKKSPATGTDYKFTFGTAAAIISASALAVYSKKRKDEEV